MGLRRYEKEFDTWAGNVSKKIKITSPVLSENVPYTIYQNTISDYIKEDPLGVSTGWDWYITPTVPKIENPYYWDDDHSFNLANKLISGTQYADIAACVKAFTSMMFRELTTRGEAFSTSFDSRDYVEFSSKMQACFGLLNAGAFAVPYLTGVVGAGMIVPSEKRTIQFLIQIHLSGAQSFNNNTGLWSKVDNSPIYEVNGIGIADAYFVPSEFSDAVDFFIAAISNMDALPGVSPVYSGSGFAYTAASSTYVWFWYRFNSSNALLEQIGYSSVLGFQLNGIWASGWTRDGDVDPTPPDPDPDPEPYPPTPPIPPTPDPPVPVDPVDPVPIPPDPPIGEVGSGFVTVYNPDKTDVKELARKFWDPNVWDMLKQHFTNPFDAIIGLTIIPVTPDNIGNQPLVIGNYNTHISTNRVTSEYKTANLGSVYIPKFFNSYLDYDPYTKYQLFLPFIGEVALNADEITSKTINITYKINVITGDCVAFLSKNNSVFAEYNGNCARQISITKGNLEEILANAVQFAATAVTMGMSMGATGAIGDAIESTATNAAGELSKSGEIRLAGAEARMSSMNANTFSAGINAVMGAKMSYSKAGNPGQGAGQISVRTPFITVTRPNLTLPENIDQAAQSSLRRYVGYPTNKIGPLSSFHGLTIVEACQLSSQHATDGEIAEALEIMKGGVIL